MTGDALRPWLHHAMQCAATEGYGVRDGVRLTAAKPCDCGLDAALGALPDRGLDVERLARAEYEEDATLYKRQRKPPWIEMVTMPGAPHNPAKAAQASNGTVLTLYRDRARRILARMSQRG